jgi:GH25 family lysozyme M1 (1,4-beta-N-acetylmuramidase)
VHFDGTGNQPDKLMTINGLDISVYQEDERNGKFIDWPALAADPRQFKFIWIKATEGDHWGEEVGGYPQHAFERQFAGAKSVKLLTGAYHYYCSWIDPKKQANWFYEIAGDNDCELPPMLDFEDPLVRIPQIVDTASGNRALAIARAEAEKVRVMVDATDQKFGRASLIYSGSWWWNPIFYQVLYYDGPGKLAWINGHANLNADYTHEPATLMTGFDRSFFHQYTSTPLVKVEGIPVGLKGPGLNVDLDHWEGADDEFYAWAGMTPPVVNETWAQAIDAWARAQGYTGPKPT